MKMIHSRVALAAAAGLLAAGCGSPRLSGSGTFIDVAEFGMLKDKPVLLYTLKNKNGLTAKVTNFGAILTELHVPDRRGKMADVVLGFDTISGYLARHPYFGATVGRVANRIAGAKFTLGGKPHKLTPNLGSNHLHGGKSGFDRHLWEAVPKVTRSGPSIKFTRTSPDGEEGYPGTLKATVVYTLTHRNELKIEMSATTDAPTIVNMAHHTYWNLAGHASGNILGHQLRLNSDRYTPADAALIPTGEVKDVAGTPFRFTFPKRIGADIAKVSGGYDVNFVIDGNPRLLRTVGTLTDPISGRSMTLKANMPGVQLYTGNFLDGSITGKGGAVYGKHQGVCLETQRFPNAINIPAWRNSVVLKPGETYQHVMVHAFSAK